MRLKKVAIILAVMTFAAAALAQTAPGAGTQGALRIVAPKAGEKISTSFVTVRYELLNPASAASSPTFQLRLDGRDPVRTTDTEHTFTGLTPGKHTVVIEMVDANNTPIGGTRSEVQFTVTQAAPRGVEATPDHSDLVNRTYHAGEAELVPAVLTFTEKEMPRPQEDEEQQAGERARQLPRSSSALPLLSIVGMGVLVGGLISAMRSR